MSTVLRENKEAIFERWLAVCKRDAQLGAVPISDEERSDHLPQVFDELIGKLEKNDGNNVSEKANKAAAIHGQERYLQGFDLQMVLHERSLLRHVVYSVLQQNLLAVDISYIISDMIQISDNLDEQLEPTVEAYLESAARKLAS